MAPDATRHDPGRTASLFHWLFPSREHLAISIGIETALTVLGVPLWAHLLLGAPAHLFALAWLS